MRRILSLAAAATLLPTALLGQVAASARLDRYTFATSERVGIRSVELRALPLEFRVGVTPYLRVEGTGGYGEATVVGSLGERRELTGLSDAELALVLLPAGGRILVRGVVGPKLPSATLSIPESSVAGVLASELLPVALDRWGSGGRVGLDLGAAAPVGSIDLVLAAGARFPMSHAILEGAAPDYRAGRQLRATAAVAGRVGRSGRLSISVGVQSFEHDEWGGGEVYQPGRRRDALVSLAFPMGLDHGVLLFAGYRERAVGEVLAQGSAFPLVVGSPKQQVGRAGFRAALRGSRAILSPEGEVRIVRSGGVFCYRTYVGASYEEVCPAEQGWMGSAGASLDLLVAGRWSGPRVLLRAGGHARRGEVVALDGTVTDAGGIITTTVAGARSPVTGWGAELGLRFEGGR